MTKTSTTTKATKPTTLEKMWSNMQNKDNDVEMEDEETKNPEETIDHIKRNQEKPEKVPMTTTTKIMNQRKQQHNTNSPYASESKQTMKKTHINNTGT